MTLPCIWRLSRLRNGVPTVVDSAQIRLMKACLRTANSHVSVWAAKQRAASRPSSPKACEEKICISGCVIPQVTYQIRLLPYLGTSTPAKTGLFWISGDEIDRAINARPCRFFVIRLLGCGREIQPNIIGSFDQESRPSGLPQRQSLRVCTVSNHGLFFRRFFFQSRGDYDWP